MTGRSAAAPSWRPAGRRAGRRARLLLQLSLHETISVRNAFSCQTTKIQVTPWEAGSFKKGIETQLSRHWLWNPVANARSDGAFGLSGPCGGQRVPELLWSVRLLW